MQSVFPLCGVKTMVYDLSLIHISFADWAEDSAYFYRKKAKCELISTDDLEAYTDFLSQQDVYKRQIQQEAHRIPRR